MTLIDTYLPRIQRYLAARSWDDVPLMAGRRFAVSTLAQGEYNLNYLLSDNQTDLVFRVNVGTQIARDDQVLYEYGALRLLEASGRTPLPYFVDDSRSALDRGILIMEYLPGEPLNYRVDLAGAAALLAAVHQVEVPAENNHLIREDAPLTMICEECGGLLETYFRSDLADPHIRDYLRQVIQWAREARSRERFYQADPLPCIVNTEVNSGNFIVNRERGTLHLVDWEMPRWGDPSQDLSHFCSPLTTLWKTDFRMTAAQKRDFISNYRRDIRDPHLKDTLEDRIRLRDPFVFLRGISWSAMGWTAYQTGFDGLKNESTWETLRAYMDLTFIRSLFDPYLES